MRKLIQSRRAFFLLVLAVSLVSAAGGFAVRDSAWTPEELWSTDSLWVVLLSLLLAGGAYLSRRRGQSLLPSGSLLWGLLGLALVYDVTSNLFAFAAPWQLPLSVLLTMGCLCLLRGLLRGWASLLWFPFFLLELAQVAGFLEYGTRINSLVLAETMEASGEEALAYLTPGNLCLLAGAVVLAALFCLLQRWLLRRQKRLQLMNAGFLFCLLSSLFVLSIPPHLKSSDYYWPVAEVRELYRAGQEALTYNQATIQQAESLPSPTLQPSSISTLRGGEGVVLVVHIGESVRADRMSINGYVRDTTPWLRRQKDLINFPDCISAACDTCQAQIAILTDARRGVHETNPDLLPRTGSVLELFDANTFTVYSFFGRRSGQQLKYDRVVRMLTRCSAERFNAPGSPWTSVPQMSDVLRAHRRENLVLFINNEGSHTPFSHFDAEHPPFTPAGDSFESPSRHAEEVNNAYDNTVHYTDEFVRRVIRELKGRPFVYLYISDHGEYLGHDGIWGRAALGESRHKYHSTTGCRVGMFVLASPELEKLHPHFAEALRTLREQSSMTVGQEHVFHTLLGLFGVQTPWYNPLLDLTRPGALPYSGPRPGAGEEPGNPSTL